MRPKKNFLTPIPFVILIIAVLALTGCSAETVQETVEQDEPPVAAGIEEAEIEAPQEIPVREPTEAPAEEMAAMPTEEAAEEAQAEQATEAQPEEGAEAGAAQPTEVEEQREAQAEQPAEETEANAVEVGLTEYEINMPDSIPAGETVFQVTNNGTIEHNFEIEGQGLEEEFEMNLPPGETRTMQVNLEPGEYEVYCPVADHEEEGMQLALQVTEATESQAGQ